MLEPILKALYARKAYLDTRLVELQAAAIRAGQLGR